MTNCFLGLNGHFFLIFYNQNGLLKKKMKNVYNIIRGKINNI